MNLSEIKHINIVGKFILRENNNKNIINIIWDENCDKNILKSNKGRIYFLIVNNEIYKIGGSTSNGGIKNTISSYCNCMNGSPSLRTFGIPMLIKKEIEQGKNVELGLMLCEQVEMKIVGITNTYTVMVNPYKETERACLEEYKLKFNKYPNWNFKENNQKWPTEIHDRWLKILEINKKNKI